MAEPAAVDGAEIAGLIEFDTPTIANGLDLLGIRDPTAGYTGPDVRCLMPELGVRAGVAVTARLDTTTAGTDETSMDLFWRLLRRIEAVSGAGAGAGAGDRQAVPVFAVVESVGPRPRRTVTIGDGMGTHLKLAGATGFLTNGSIRDIGGVRAVPLPCWAAGLSPMHGRLRWLDIECPVVIDGMTVRPGDVIHADENGALCIPPAALPGLRAQATAVREHERRLFDRLAQPGMTTDAFLRSDGR